MRVDGDRNFEVGYQSDESVDFDEVLFKDREVHTTFETDKISFEELLHNKRWGKTNLGSQKVEVYRLKQKVSPATVILKSSTEFSHIPKRVIVKALSDLKIRAKWDDSLGQIEVIE